ncbi:MAG: hypothetical protein Q9213_005097 [Squamulea squamosa]
MTAGEVRRGLSAPPSGSGSIYASPRKRNLPPPPKDGEKFRSPEFYTFPPSEHPSSASVSPRSSIGNPEAVTALSPRDSFQPGAMRSQAQSVVHTTRTGSHEQPSVYIQDPYAAELTPEQRFAAEQENQPDSELVLPLPSTHSRKQSSASIVLEDTVGSMELENGRK